MPQTIVQLHDLISRLKPSHAIGLLLWGIYQISRVNFSAVFHASFPRGYTIMILGSAVVEGVKTHCGTLRAGKMIDK